jgi:hypothetical protein
MKSNEFTTAVDRLVVTPGVHIDPKVLEEAREATEYLRSLGLLKTPSITAINPFDRRLGKSKPVSGSSWAKRGN